MAVYLPMSQENRRRKALRRKAKAREVRRQTAKAPQSPVEGRKRQAVRQATDVAIAGLSDVRKTQGEKAGGDVEGLAVIEEERKLLEIRRWLQTATRGKLRAAGMQGRSEAEARYALSLESHMKARHGAEGSIDTPQDLIDADALHESLHGRGETPAQDS